jgi:hypothetical protein
MPLSTSRVGITSPVLLRSRSFVDQRAPLSAHEGLHEVSGNDFVGGSGYRGRVRNLSPMGSQQSADAALQHEFGSLNTGRVRNLTKKPQ